MVAVAVPYRHIYSHRDTAPWLLLLRRLSPTSVLQRNTPGTNSSHVRHLSCCLHCEPLLKPLLKSIQISLSQQLHRHSQSWLQSNRSLRTVLPCHSWTRYSIGLGIPSQAAFHSSAHSMAAALPTRKPSRATGPSSSNRSTTQSTSSANSKIPLKNHNITAAEVLVISATGESLGVQPILQAMKMFDQALNDLVVVSSTQTPPNKAPSDLANAESADTHRNLNADSGTTKGLAKKRTGAAPVKELEINSTITAHDLQTKMKKGSELLRKGCSFATKCR
ncbi:hypothetical protein BASA83_013698 [Batrachochytrium salamandrivorans]|nr:hypothetical protein BASA83_013698 [Batrachochytrium salamandrivorans]